MNFYRRVSDGSAASSDRILLLLLASVAKRLVPPDGRTRTDADADSRGQRLN